MLMSIGSVVFEVAPFNAHRVDYSAETAFAEKGVMGAEPPLEYVGEGANTWEIQGRLFPKKFGGLDTMENMHAQRISGQPQYMMRGDGKALGWVNILSITEASQYLDEKGVGQIIEFTISVRRAQKPADGMFHSSMQGAG